MPRLSPDGEEAIRRAMQGEKAMRRPRYYAGIGSRKTPRSVLRVMTECARTLSAMGYTLRSGGAPGADTAFELGAGTRKEIFLPWRGFRKPLVGYDIVVPDMKPAMDLAAQFHPTWERLNRAARLLIARNGYQILGANLREPVDFVLCWTRHGMWGGGTGQAIRIAMRHGIGIYDLGWRMELPEVLRHAQKRILADKTKSSSNDKNNNKNKNALA